MENEEKSTVRVHAVICANGMPSISARMRGEELASAGVTDVVVYSEPKMTKEGLARIVSGWGDDLVVIPGCRIYAPSFGKIVRSYRVPEGCMLVVGSNGGLAVRSESDFAWAPGKCSYDIRVVRSPVLLDRLGVKIENADRCSGDFEIYGKSETGTVFDGRVIVGLASYPAREEGMIHVVDTLAPQCDEMHVALNEYGPDSRDAVLSKLRKYKNVFPVFYTESEDLGCQNKFRPIDLCRQGDYLLTVDDDIDYPRDYVRKMVHEIERLGHDCIVSFHGKTVRETASGFEVVGHMYYNSLQHDVDAMSVGCGVCGCVPRSIDLSFSVFDRPKNSGDDLLMAEWAERKGVRRIVAPHRAGWIRHNLPVERTSPLYANRRITRSMKCALVNMALGRVGNEGRGCGEETMEVAYIADNMAMEPLLASLQSLLESSCRFKTNIHASILFSGNGEAFDNIAASMSSGGLSVSAVPIARDVLEKCVAAGAVTSSMKKASATCTALVKFELPNIFPQLDTVLYLDCDTIVKGNLSELYETGSTKVVSDIGAITFGEVPEWKLPRKRMEYFNSGVMLLNLAWMRENGIVQKLWEAKRTISDQTLMDQNALNAVLSGALHVGPRFNFLVTSLAGLEERQGRTFIDKVNGLYGTEYDGVVSGSNSMLDDAVVLHYAGRMKPWGSAAGNNMRHFRIWREVSERAKRRLAEVVGGD